MRLQKIMKAVLVGAVVVASALAVSLIQTGVAEAGDLYATGIKGGKVRPPLIDIENKTTPPEKQPEKKELRPIQAKKADSAEASSVEDAGKYDLYIAPVYPRNAHLASKQGIVEIDLTFDAKGKMKDAIIRNCTTPGWGFEQATLAASLEAKLSGHGDRVVTVRTKIKFELQ